MLLFSRNGILCDLCGTEHKDKFTYYSASGKKIMVNYAASSVLPIGKDLDLDICESCCNDLIARATINTGVIQNGIKCNLTSQVLMGAFEYWKIIFDRVDVDIDQEDTTKVTSNIMDLDIGPNACSELKKKKSIVMGAAR